MKRVLIATVEIGIRDAGNRKTARDREQVWRGALAAGLGFASLDDVNHTMGQRRIQRRVYLAAFEAAKYSILLEAKGKQ